MKIQIQFFSLLLTAFIFVAGDSQAQSVYYVDAINGNNSNSGTSEPLAWKTVAKVNSASLIPGDIVLFKRGQIWNEQLRITRPGTPARVITFGVFGSGGAPTINGSNRTIPTRGDGIINVNANNILLDGLKAASSGGYGIKISPSVSNITVQNCEVNDTIDGGIIAEDGLNIVVKGCKVSNTNQLGTSAWHEAITMHNIGGFEVMNNEVLNCREDGIDAKYDSRNGKIYNNRVNNSNGPEIYIDAAHDIEVYGNVLSGSAADKAGIGIAVETTANPNRLNTYNLNIHNNVIFDNGHGIWVWLENGAQEFANLYGIKILNNTIVDNSRGNGGGIWFLPGGSPANFTSGNEIRNNIIYNNTVRSGAKVIRNDSGGASRFVISNNLIRTGEPSDVVNLNQVETTAPGFVNAASRDYNLTSASPARDRGVQVGLPFTGSAPDIGAFELSSTPPDIIPPANPTGLREQ